MSPSLDPQRNCRASASSSCRVVINFARNKTWPRCTRSVPGIVPAPIQTFVTTFPLPLVPLPTSSVGRSRARPVPVSDPINFLADMLLKTLPEPDYVRPPTPRVPPGQRVPPTKLKAASAFHTGHHRTLRFVQVEIRLRIRIRIRRHRLAIAQPLDRKELPHQQKSPRNIHPGGEVSTQLIRGRTRAVAIRRFPIPEPPS